MLYLVRPKGCSMSKGKRVFKQKKLMFALELPPEAVTMMRRDESVARWVCPSCGGQVFSDERLLNFIAEVKAKEPAATIGPRCKPCKQLLVKQAI